MTKISLLVVFIWIWHCVVYGQFPLNNFDPHHPYYIPYTSTYINQPGMQTNDKTAVGEAGGLYNQQGIRNLFNNVALYLKINQLEAAIASLTIQLNEKVSKSDLDATNLQVSALKVLSSPNTNGAIPTSCGDLKTFGFVKSGIYSIMVNKQVQNVYCDFTKSNDADLQTLIGTVDVKSAPVYFHAQRTSSYSTVSSVVPFDLIRLNLGNAFDPSGVGLFVAPVSGEYFFSYSGLSDGGVSARVVLEVKTAKVDWSRVGEGYGDPSFQTFAFHATLKLLKGDQVRLFLTEGAIHDIDSRLYTNFVGFLIAQDELTV